MSLYSTLHFLSLIVYICMASFALYKVPKLILNKTFAVLMVCFAMWNFSDVFLHNHYLSISKDTAVFFQNISSFGWVGFSSAILSFSLAFSKKDNILKSKFFIAAIFAIPVFLIYKQWTGCLLIGSTQEFYGWSYSWADTKWTYIFFVYYISSALISVYLIYRYGKTTDKLYEKKQSKIIVFSIISSLLIGSLFDVLIPMLNIQSVPQLGNVFVLIFAFGLFYAMVQYKFLDITPATAAENIISTMGELLVLLNKDGNIVTVNRATLNSLKYKQKELKGKSIKMLFKDVDSENVLLRKIISGENIGNYESSFKTKDGKEIFVIFSSSPLKDEQGCISGMVFIARDITVYKKVEEEKEKLNIQLLQSEKLAAIGQLAGGFAHEINNPLTVILGYAQIIAEETKKKDSLYEKIKSIEKEANRCKMLIRNLLTFARISKLEKEMVDVNNVIAEIVSLVNIHAKLKNIEIISECSGDVPQIRINRNQFQQVIMNLCNNAIDAMSDAGKMTIKTKQIEDRIEIEISDTGNGMTEEVKKHIFEPFFTTKETGKGTGLGLSLSYEIVQRHNGTIEVESEADKGSTFIIRLPVRS